MVILSVCIGLIKLSNTNAINNPENTETYRRKISTFYHFKACYKLQPTLEVFYVC